MIEGCPFLYQSMHRVVFHVTAGGVKVVKSLPTEKPIVAFIDGDKGDYEPESFLLSRSVQLVVASSPKGASQKWTKQMGHASSITRLAIKLWSRKELFLTGLVSALFSTLD
jgi:hypothetical protein